MLGNSSIIGFIPTNNANRARSFYQDVVGLRFVSDDGFAIVMDAGGTMLRIVRVGEFAPQRFTILGWEVRDIDAEVAELSARGLDFCLYPFLEQSANRIWTAPGGAAKVAWFSDPDGNILSLSEHA